MKLTPLGDRVIVQPQEPEAVTASGLILPDLAQERSQRGTVVASAVDELGEGSEVLFSKYGASKLAVNGEVYFVLHEKDVIARIDA